jgi:two-component system sensor histidine kinase ChvG
MARAAGKPTTVIAGTPGTAGAVGATVPFLRSVRAKFLLAACLLLAVPVTGVLYLRELSDVLRLGQEQVAVSATKLIAAALSDRPGLALRKSSDGPIEGASVVGNSTDNADPERERLLALFNASDANLAAALGSRYQPDAAIERILTQSVVKDARVWVFDIHGNVRGIAGALNSPIATSEAQDWNATLSQLLLADNRTSAFVENIAESTEAIAQQSQRAILGQPTREWRRQRIPSIGVVSVAEPIWRGDNIVGGVVLEESDTSQRALARRAAETVMIGGGVVLLVAIGGLLWFAFSVVRRITRLQRHAAEAVDVQGRVRHDLLDGLHHPRHAGSDEIGALTHTLDAMVTRQARYNQYLEQLAARLSHELRTPVAVVRSSLDNLRSETLSDDARTFLARADEGVTRLSTIISRMSEATQLERMLQGATRERIDLVALVRGCVEGYRLAFPLRKFAFESSEASIIMQGVPDAIAQMLDKLAQNAVDFARDGTTITVRVALEGSDASITVENIGPLLPSDLSTLFESMVSVREGKYGGASSGKEAHLGLGLYVARLVAEHHDGKISARNLDAGDGVVFRVVMPLGG